MSEVRSIIFWLTVLPPLGYFLIEREGLVESARVVGDYLKAGIKGLMAAIPA